MPEVRDVVDGNVSKSVGGYLSSGRRAPAIALLMLSFAVCHPVYAPALEQRTDPPDRQQEDGRTKQRFLSALRAYKTQQYAAAEKQLEPLVHEAPGNFEANELLGLVLVAQDEQAQANRFLSRAVQLKPNLTEARTALATNLLALHRAAEAEIQFKKAVELDPRGYDANHNLGEFYIASGNIRNAIPFLERAQGADATAYNNSYDLALALDETDRLEEARQQLRHLIPLHDSAELHSLLGEVEEKSRNYLASAQEYEQAARMDPSEQNILNWGAELLLHQTFMPAIEVFRAGTERFPESAQLQNGLGIAFYGAAQTDDAVHAFFRASDLAPSDQLSLTFLGKACDHASPALADQIRSRLQGFLARQAQSAELHYYVAACLSRTSPGESKTELDAQVESHLKQAVTLDPNYADAYFQLGVLYAEERKYREAAAQYERALQIHPNVANFHYRLGQALARVGDEPRATEELRIFEKLRQSESEATDKEQSQIQQFVYKMRKSDAN